MASDQAFRASNRFGLGPRPGELEAIGADPRAWLEAQLDSPDRPEPALGAIPPSRETLARLLGALREMRDLGRAPAGRDAAEDRSGRLAAMRRELRRGAADAQIRQLGARLEAGLATATPYRERLAQFWSNHFTVSTAGGKPLIATSCAAYEIEAVRAHLDGHFADMLLAVAQHPVMLAYLDNLQSMGPDSPAGRRRGRRGLNENLAREILELHTLGVDGGFDQDDVAALARIITGWTMADGRRIPGEPGRFAFAAAMHEPGPRRLLGRVYREDGVAQGERALADLAAHPATARFLATKLARHFVDDRPPAAAVERLARVFRDTDGHLPSVHRAIVALDAGWDPARRKLKTPNELLVSTLRGLDLRHLPARPLLGSLRLLNQYPFTAPSPAGWPDEAEHWGSPNALLQRIGWATQVAERVGSHREPGRLLAHMSDPGHRAVLGRSIEGAASTAQGVALLLAGPAFQWR